jgi:hypothetical protein
MGSSRRLPPERVVESFQDLSELAAEDPQDLQGGI